MAGRKPSPKVQKTVAAWMLTVMQANNWSADEWARRAETSATNITRALQEGGTAPSADTLIRLCEAAGSQPNLSGKREYQSLFYSVPLLDAGDIEMVGMMDSKQQAEHLAKCAERGPVVATLFKPSPNAFAVRLSINTMSARGMFAGDIIIVEPGEKFPLESGCTVVARVGVTIGAYTWQPPYLLAMSMDAGFKPVPLTDARIVGKAVHLERSL